MNWSYLAGFIDGDGSIRCYDKRPRIVIGQKDPEALYLIREFLELPNAVGFSKSSGIYYLQINRRSHVRTVLENVLPDLIVKRADALEALVILNAGGYKWSPATPVQQLCLFDPNARRI